MSFAVRRGAAIAKRRESDASAAMDDDDDDDDDEDDGEAGEDEGVEAAPAVAACPSVSSFGRSKSTMTTSSLAHATTQLRRNN